jgi:hypothetical protein
MENINKGFVNTVWVGITIYTIIKAYSDSVERGDGGLTMFLASIVIGLLVGWVFSISFVCTKFGLELIYCKLLKKDPENLGSLQTIVINLLAFPLTFFVFIYNFVN